MILIYMIRREPQRVKRWPDRGDSLNCPSACDFLTGSAADLPAEILPRLADDKEASTPRPTPEAIAHRDERVRSAREIVDPQIIPTRRLWLAA